MEEPVLAGARRSKSVWIWALSIAAVVASVVLFAANSEYRRKSAEAAMLSAGACAKGAMEVRVPALDNWPFRGLAQHVCTAEERGLSAEQTSVEKERGEVGQPSTEVADMPIAAKSTVQSSDVTSRYENGRIEMADSRDPIISYIDHEGSYSFHCISAVSGSGNVLMNSEETTIHYRNGSIERLMTPYFLAREGPKCDLRTGKALDPAEEYLAPWGFGHDGPVRDGASEGEAQVKSASSSVRLLPRKVAVDPGEQKEYCGADNTVWTMAGNIRTRLPRGFRMTLDGRVGVPCRVDGNSALNSR